MKKGRIVRVAGLLVTLALVSVWMTGTVSAQTHKVFAELGTATW